MSTQVSVFLFSGLTRRFTHTCMHTQTRHVQCAGAMFPLKSGDERSHNGARLDLALSLSPLRARSDTLEGRVFPSPHLRCACEPREILLPPYIPLPPPQALTEKEAKVRKTECVCVSMRECVCMRV